jgi:hypothetical protein
MTTNRQSTLRKVLYGAIFGLIFYFTSGGHEHLPSYAGFGELLGYITGSIALYIVLYWIWPHKK